MRNVAENAIVSTQKKTTRIKPGFDSNNTSFDRIMAMPTHFNSKPFDIFISDQEAVTISNAIGLKELDNHHGTTFYSSEKGVLYITFQIEMKYVTTRDI